MIDTYAMFLNTDVGQVNIHVIQLCNAGVVFDGAETAESQPEHVSFERSERCY